ncbi:MAG TPA: hypothetical protein VHE55_10015 [Fimbriimonadaceae bacterium]|nr:hypothetical protein [Fimbriimonadaceae bacterium]
MSASRTDASDKLDRIAVLCPTRGRSHKAHEVVGSWLETTSGQSDFWFVIDDDEAEGFPEIPRTKALVAKRGRRGMADPCNVAAGILSGQYRYVMFVGDDHRFRSPAWDAAFLRAVKGQGDWGYVYGNDLYQGANLPTAVMVTSNIIDAIGHFIWPELQHLYIDNYWLALGQAIGRITYLDSVIIEHMHYLLGKSEHDESYRAVNAPDVSARDAQAFAAWNSGMKSVEAATIRSLMQCES